MHYLYIIYSPSKEKYYVGETDDVVERLNKHNNHSYKGSYTKIANDWTVVLNFECSSRNEALFLESFIKRMKSKKFIAKVIQSPLILTDILQNR